MRGSWIAMLLACVGLVCAEEAARGMAVQAPDGQTPVGTQYLFVIGIDQYQHWSPLRGAVAEAEKLRQVLQQRYCFEPAQTSVLLNGQATKAAIVQQLARYQELLQPHDSLLLLYCGHGHLDERSKTGFWIPVDGGLDENTQDRWITNHQLRGLIAGMRSRHVLIVADSCFSGDLLDTSRAKPEEITNDYYRRAYARVARQVMTSGASENVADSSAFGDALYRELDGNVSPWVDPLRLFDHVRLAVTRQTPLLGALTDAGHQQGGTFLLFLRPSAMPATAPIAPIIPIAPTPPPPIARPPAGPVEGQAWTVPEVGLEFVWITVLNAWVGKYEVTNGEYRRMKSDHDSEEYKGHTLNGDRQPVVYVNFADAQAYAAWLTARERQAGRLPAGWSYRLPTEREWETFASCGDQRTYPWGNAMPPRYGNYAGEEIKQPFGFSGISGYRDGHIVAAPVEQSGKNDWGLYGVGGNVWEVTAGNSDKNVFGAWRGESWYYYGRDSLRVSYSRIDFASYRVISHGFRLLLSR